MKSANIASARNQLSRLLMRVKRGETVLITERNHPVARLEPVAREEDVVGRLHAMGILAPPRDRGLDVRAFLAAPRPRLRRNNSLAGAVLAERADGR